MTDSDIENLINNGIINLKNDFSSIEYAFDNNLKVESKIFSILNDAIINEGNGAFNENDYQKAYYITLSICIKNSDYIHSNNLIQNYKRHVNEKDYQIWFYSYLILISGKRTLNYFLNNVNRLVDIINKFDDKDFVLLDITLTDLLLFYINEYNKQIGSNLMLGKLIVAFLKDLKNKCLCYNKLSSFMKTADALLADKDNICSNSKIINLTNDEQVIDVYEESGEIATNKQIEEQLPISKPNLKETIDLNMDLSNNRLVEVDKKLFNSVIYVVGALPKNSKDKYIQFAKQNGVNEKNLIFVGYDDCTNYAWDRKVKDNPNIIGIIIGAAPHKGKSIGKFDSIYNKFINEEGYPKVYECRSNSVDKRFKISFTNFKDNIINIIMDFYVLNGLKPKQVVDIA